jgi:hypothetical protein
VFLAGIGVLRDKIEIQLLLNRQLFSVLESRKKGCVVNAELKTQAENAINMIKKFFGGVNCKSTQQKKRLHF